MPWISRTRTPGGTRSSLALLLALLITGSALEGQTSPAPKKSSPEVAEAPGQDRTPPGFGQSASEADLSARILELHRRMPADVRRPSTMSVEELHALVDEVLGLGEQYLARFPDGAARKDVLFPIARLWIVNNTRFFVELSRRIQEQTGQSADSAAIKRVREQYFQKVLGVVAEGLEKHPEGEMNREFWKLRGQAAWFSNQYDLAIEAYKTLLERYPDDPESSQNLLALMNAYISDRKHGEAVEMADLFLLRHPTDDLAPHVYQLKGKALVEGGRAAEALVWWDSIGDTLRNGSKGQPVKIGETEHVWGPEARQIFQRYYDERGFMLGFLQFYLGRYEEARNSLAASLEELMELQAANRIEPRSQVFLGRTDKVHGALLTLAERPAPDLGIDIWLDDLPLDLTAERGNVIALAFTPFENPRYEDIQRILQRLYRERWHEGLRVAWISDPKGFGDVAAQVPRVEAQRKRLGLTYPIGLESEKGWPNFQRFQASVGGGTLVVIDRAGNVAWYKMDPTFRDERLVEALFDRLLGAPKPEGN